MQFQEGLPESNVDLALIDDDELVRMTWELMAKQRGQRLLSFSSGFTFFKAQLHRQTPIFVDYCFAGDLAGVDLAKKIIDQGFYNVFFTTGLPREHLSLPKGLKGVIGKEYPEIIVPSSKSLEKGSMLNPSSLKPKEQSSI